MSNPTSDNVSRDPSHDVSTQYYRPVETETDTKVSTELLNKIYADQLAQSPADLEPDQPRDSYITDPKTPHLNPPHEHAGASQDTVEIQRKPYRHAERATIRQTFASEFIKILEEKGADLGMSLTAEMLAELMDALATDPDHPEFEGEFAELANEAFEKALAFVKSHYFLPPDFKFGSSRASNWTPTTTYAESEPPPPYSPKEQTEILEEYEKVMDKNIMNVAPELTPDEKQTVLSLIRNPNQPELLEQFAELAKIAQKAKELSILEMRSIYSLPESWFPESEDSINWTPTQVNPIDPAMRNNNCVHGILNNSAELIDELTSNFENLIGLLPEGTLEGITSDQLLLVVLKALEEFKKYLYEAGSAQDAKRVEALSNEKVSMALKSLQDFMKKLRKMKKARKKQKGMKIANGLMIALGAVITLISVICSPLTLGATIGLAAVGVAMMAIGIANMQTGFMDKAIMKLVNWMASWFDNLGLSEAAKKAIAYAIIAIVLVVLIVLATIFTGGSATGSMIGQVVRTFATQVTTQVSLQVAGSVLGGLVIEAMKASPDPKVREAAEKNEMWIRLVVSLIVMITAIGSLTVQNKSLFQGMKGDGVVGQLTDTSPKLVKNLGTAAIITQAVGQGLVFTGGVSTGVLQVLTTMLRREVDQLEAEVAERDALIEMVNKIIDMLMEAQKGNLATIQSIQNTQNQILDSLGKSTTAMYQSA